MMYLFQNLVRLELDWNITDIHAINFITCIRQSVSLKQQTCCLYLLEYEGEYLKMYLNTPQKYLNTVYKYTKCN